MSYTLAILGCLALLMASHETGNASATVVKALNLASATSLNQQTSLAVSADSDSESIEEIDAGEQEQTKTKETEHAKE